MRSPTRWLLLALCGTVATTMSGIYLFGRITELQEASGQPSPWQLFTTEVSVRHWNSITLLLEAASVVLWFIFAHKWGQASSSRSSMLRYSVAAAAAFLGPCVLLIIFALI